MNTITAQNFADIIENIVADGEKLAELQRQPFVGVNNNEVLAELSQRLGNSWIITKTPPVNFSKDDIDAVANHRFYKRSGQKLLMLWALIILALLQLVVWLPIINNYTYYGISFIVTLWFVAYYSRKQNKVRNELRKEIGIEVSESK